MTVPSNWLVLALAFLAGAALPLQAGANAELARVLGHPLSAALVSALVGVLFMLLVMLVYGAPAPPLASLKAAPPWSWIGGLSGVAFLVLAILSAPKLGAATFIALAVAGQMTVSILIDHFAWIGFENRPATIGRLAGAVLVITGAFLVQFSEGQGN